MPVAAGAVVAAWVTAAGATAATAAFVGAVTTAAVTGAIVGGVLGATTALISGGNILEGTLKGALIGGIIGGVSGGIGHLAAGATAVAAPAGSQIAGGTVHGSIASGEAALTAANISAPAGPGLLGGADFYTGPPVAPTGGSVFAPPVQPVAPVTPSGAATAPLSADAQMAQIMAQSRLDMATVNAAALKNQMIVGGVQGLATSAGTVLAAKDKAKSDKELLDAQAAREEAKKAGNLVGEYSPLFMKFTLPESWRTSMENPYDKYIKRGLLAGGVA